MLDYGNGIIIFCYAPIKKSVLLLKHPNQKKDNPNPRFSYSFPKINTFPFFGKTPHNTKTQNIYNQYFGQMAYELVLSFCKKLKPMKKINLFYFH